MQKTAYEAGIRDAAAVVRAAMQELEANIDEDAPLHAEGQAQIKPLPHALRWLTDCEAAIRAMLPDDKSAPAGWRWLWREIAQAAHSYFRPWRAFK